MYTDYPSSKYTSGSSRDHCQYTTKYGEDCHYNKYSQKDSCSYKTWPKQQYVDEAGQAYSQDDQNIQYLHELEENARLIQQQQQEHAGAKYAQVSKKHKQRDYYEDRGTRSREPKAEQSYTQEQIQAARQAQEVVQCTKADPGELQDHKYLESTSAESKERAAQQQQQASVTNRSVKDIAKDIAKEKAAVSNKELVGFGVLETLP